MEYTLADGIHVSNSFAQRLTEPSFPLARLVSLFVIIIISLISLRKYNSNRPILIIIQMAFLFALKIMLMLANKVESYTRCCIWVYTIFLAINSTYPLPPCIYKKNYTQNNIKHSKRCLMEIYLVRITFCHIHQV